MEPRRAHQAGRKRGVPGAHPLWALAAPEYGC